MRKPTLLLCLILLYNLGWCSIKTEYYQTFHYTSDEGLPHSLVFEMAQGNDGYIWVATNNGLGRFDGYSFKVYRPKKDKAFSLTGKSIRNLYFDSNNNLWLNIQGYGLNRMDLDTEKFYKYYPDYSDTSAISGNDINCFFQDTDSIIWVGTNKGLDYFNQKLDRFINCFEVGKQELYDVSSITQDKFGNIWYISNSQIGYYAKSKKSTYKLSSINNELWAKSLRVNNILVEKGKFLWIASKNAGLICYNIETREKIIQIPNFNDVQKLFLSKNGHLFALVNNPTPFLIAIPESNKFNAQYTIVYQFNMKTPGYYIDYCQDMEGNLWISSDQGLFKISPDFSVSKIRSQNYVENDLLENNIYCQFIDKMGNLWLKSERKGILMIDLYQKPFYQYKYLKGMNKIISSDNITAVYEDSHNNIWVGAYNEGVTCFNQQSNTFKSIPYSTYHRTKIVFKAPSAFCEDSEGNIWIGFYDAGLVKVNPHSLNIQYITNKNSMKNFRYDELHSIRKIIRDKAGNLWMITNSNGLVELNMQTGKFNFHSELYELDFHTNSHYRYLCETKDGLFWTGTQNGGLGRYNKTSHEFIHYRETNNPCSINGNTVYHIYEESDSILWIGTDKGLNKFNRITQNFTRFIIDSLGFQCSVYRIYPDKENNLWLSGDCGIVKFNTLSQNYVVYNKSDGLPSSEFNTTAGCVTSKGEIFFGSTLGLVSFYPSNIFSNKFPPKPIISQLKIFNKNIAPGDYIKGNMVLTKEISRTAKITLPYYLNDFTLEFSALHFASAAKNKYWYKLDGYNSDWIETDASRRWANFTGLKPGLYTFRLMAANNDGLKNDLNDEASISIEIVPPLYETWWFRNGLIILTVLLIFIFIRIRIKAIKYQKQLLEQTVRERTNELQNKNALLEERQEEISLQNEELEKHRNNLEEMVAERTKIMKQALLKAEESDRLKSAFLSNMSHEIRTPMNAILGFSDLLVEPDLPHADRIEFVELIHSNGETLLNLLNDIIDISIIESGQLQIQRKEIELNKLLQEVYSSFINGKYLEPKPELKIELLNLKSDPVYLVSDPLRLKQILNNIISNAIKYTAKGKITIAYTLDNNTVKFTIQDSGIGINPQELKNIFNRFSKIENGNTDMYRGGGLGLAICKNLVEKMGGKIWAESNPGMGSTFHFTISKIFV